MPVVSEEQMENGMVRITFERTQDEYFFRDAIVVSQAQRASMTQAQIDAIEQQRWDDWYAIVTAPSEEPEPVEEPVEGE